MINFNLLEKNPYYSIELFALVCGALLPFSFAPYGYYWLQFPLLAGLFIVCLQQSPRIAFIRAMLFGLGWFAHGVHWVFYSLHFHGGTPVPLAMFIVFMLAAVLALFPAIAFYIANRYLSCSKRWMLILVYPLIIILFEWLRGYVFTGLPWVQIGIAHVDSWLAGYAPVIGGLGMGYIACLVSALLASLLLDKKIIYNVPAIVLIYVLGYALTLIEWTEATGEPVKVSMIQGNIPQSEKWKPVNYVPTLRMYRELTLKHAESDLVIWPETAIPGFKSRVTAYLEELTEQADKTSTDVLLGIFVRDSETQRYFNSVITLDGQVYKKRHLVPLGEYFPFRPVLGFFSQWINIPMSDLDSGDRYQKLIKVAGHPVGVNICFEDAFDRDVLRDLPEAELLVNVSNDAWFEDSPQPWQHHQIARVRALETGRFLLRATNTGVSSAITPAGEVLAMSPQFRRHVLSVEVRAYSGATPYVLWSNYLLISVAVLLLLWCRRRSID